MLIFNNFLKKEKAERSTYIEISPICTQRPTRLHYNPIVIASVYSIVCYLPFANIPMRNNSHDFLRYLEYLDTLSASPHFYIVAPRNYLVDNSIDFGIVNRSVITVVVIQHR